MLGFICGCTGDDRIDGETIPFFANSGYFKTSFEDLRFIMYYDGRNVVELSDPHKVKGVNFNKPIPDFFSVVENRNDKYALYLFDDNTISSAHLSELTIFPSGDGVHFYRNTRHLTSGSSWPLRAARPRNVRCGEGLARIHNKWRNR